MQSDSLEGATIQAQSEQLSPMPAGNSTEHSNQIDLEIAIELS